MMPDNADTAAWRSDDVSEYPGDQTYDDVPSNDPAVSYWATIGPEDEAIGTWSWTINATNDACDQWEEDGGVVASEAEAKAAVEGWQPPQHNDGSVTTEREAPLQCRHCGVRIIHAPGHSGRYRYTDNLSGTDIFGSGSECPKNERGHEPQPTTGNPMVESEPCAESVVWSESQRNDEPA